MNWGNSIAVAFVLFASFIGYMVVKAFQEDFDLVTEDYYAQEINYQNKLVKLANAESFGKVVVIKQETKKLLLTFPDHQAKGTIQFYHPSREIFDKTFQITLKNGSQIIDKEDLVPGNYRININWKEGDTQFLQESKILIR
ncbi:MAG: FixH family protein [Bacteroidota bacterium]